MSKMQKHAKHVIAITFGYIYRMYSHTSWKIWDCFAPSKLGIDLYAGHSRSAYVPQIFP